MQNLLTKTPLVYGTTKKYIILIWGVYCCIYPASAGYILYISRSCGIYIIYIPWDIYFYIYPRKPSKWDIYYIYGTLSWYMQQHTPETETFFHPRIQYTPSTSAFFVLGLRPRTKNASVSGVYCSSDEKMPRFRGYIAAYTPPKHRIYITYIPFIGIYPVHDFYTKTPLVYGCTKRCIIPIWGVYCWIYPRFGGYILYISPIWGIYIIYIPQLGDICKLHGKS